MDIGLLLLRGLAETGSGLLLAVGFLTPMAAALLCSVLHVAATSVHTRKGFFITSGGFEYALVLGVAALTLAFTGPGLLSLDALLEHYLSGTLWGGAALFGGVLGGVVTLLQRRPVPKYSFRKHDISRWGQVLSVDQAEALYKALSPNTIRITLR